MVTLKLNNFEKFMTAFMFSARIDFVGDLHDAGYASACILETIDDRWFALSEEDYVRFVLTWG